MIAAADGRSLRPLTAVEITSLSLPAVASPSPRGCFPSSRPACCRCCTLSSPAWVWRWTRRALDVAAVRRRVHRLHADGRRRRGHRPAPHRVPRDPDDCRRRVHRGQRPCWWRRAQASGAGTQGCAQAAAPCGAATGAALAVGRPCVGYALVVIPSRWPPPARAPSPARSSCSSTTASALRARGARVRLGQRQALGGVKRHYRGIQVTAGVLLVVFGLLMMFGVLERLSRCSAPPGPRARAGGPARRPVAGEARGAGAEPGVARATAYPSSRRRDAPRPRRCGADGEVWTTPLRRWLYSTDASGYRIVPEVVLVAGCPTTSPSRRRSRRRRASPARGAVTASPARPSGRVSSLMLSSSTGSMRFHRGTRRARVQPGVVQAALNAAAAAHGLGAPTRRTVDQAPTIGGMVGNNSSGSRSIVYGESKDNFAGGGARRRSCRAPAATSSRASRAGRGRGGARAGARAVPPAHRPRLPLRPSTHGAPPASTCANCSPPSPTSAACSPVRKTLCFTELEVQHPAPRPSRPPSPSRPCGRRSRRTSRSSRRGAAPRSSSSTSSCYGSPRLARYRHMAPLLGGDEAALLTVEYQGRR